MRVCLFDIDGTLLESGAAGQAAMESALFELYGVSGPVEGIGMAGRTDRAIIEDLMEFFAVGVNESSFGRVSAAYLDGLAAGLGQLDKPVLPGVVELLSALSGCDDVVLGLLTGNLEDGARRKLGHFGLDRYFDRGGCLFGGFGDRQRDRDDVARSIRERIRLELGWWDPAEVWVIGDTPLDVRCARAIEARVLAVSTGLYSANELSACGPDVLLGNLSDTDRVVSVLVE